VHPDADTIPDCIHDVFDLIKQASERFGGLDNLPYQILIQQVAAYHGRVRGRGKS
jgi:hypothetical protein